MRPLKMALLVLVGLLLWGSLNFFVQEWTRTPELVLLFGIGSGAAIYWAVAKAIRSM